MIRLICSRMPLLTMLVVGLSSLGRAATPADRYEVDTTANTVTDTRTGLVWQRMIRPGTFTWDGARAQCTGGFRLPALKELLTIVDPTRTNPSIDPVFRGETAAENTPAAFFWTASPRVGSGSAWYVAFSGGGSNSVDPFSAYRVRCVR